MSKLFWHLALLVSVGLLVFFINLGGPRLWDRDEPRYAACARDMLQSGDWVVPTFNGELRVLKPVLIYWLIMSAFALFGDTEFAARFWPAVFSQATVIATYFIGRRLFNAQAGLWSALVLSTSLLFVTAGHIVKADSALTFFSAMAILVYVYAAWPPTRDATDAGGHDSASNQCFPQSYPAILVLYAMASLAFLAKGLPGLVFPVAVIGLFLLIVRLPAAAAGTNRFWAWLRPFAPLHFIRTFWSMRPLTAALVVLLIAAPWYVLVGLKTDGEFLRGFFLEHHLERAMRPMEGHSGPFLLYYLGAIAAGFFPWSAFAVPIGLLVFTQIRQRQEWRMAYILLCCWAGLYVFVFSLAKTKLPSYITPCTPALALLVGSFMYQWTTGTQIAPSWWLKLSFLSIGVGGLAVAFGVVIAAPGYCPGEELLACIGLAPIVGAVAAYLFWRREQLAAAGVALMVAAVIFTAGIFAIGVDRVAKHQKQGVLFAAIRQHSDNPRIGNYGLLEPSWVYYAGQNIELVTRANARGFFRQDDDRFILTSDDYWPELRRRLRSDAAVLAECPYFLRPGRRLLLIGHEQRDRGTER